MLEKWPTFVTLLLWMERFVLLVVTLLCIYVTFSDAEETKEMRHKESKPNDLQVRCPDGSSCPAGNKCCRRRTGPPFFRCCPYGPLSVCCIGGLYCCPSGTICFLAQHQCLRSSALVNNKDTYGRDGTAGIDTQVSKIIPSQQVERSLKGIRFLYTSGDVLSPDEKYQCPDGTSPCELFYGKLGCCPRQE